MLRWEIFFSKTKNLPKKYFKRGEGFAIITAYSNREVFLGREVPGG